MRFWILLPFFFLSLPVFSQTFTESDIKEIAEKANKQLKGVNAGNGVIIKGCFSAGRTLIYQYDVPEYWEAPYNIKEELISNVKTADLARFYFLNDINVDYHYYKGLSLVKRVSIKSNELSTFSTSLGEYISIKDHPKSKGVNLKLKVPIGWDVQEGDRPNIVKKFTKEGNTYAILIKDNMTFFSRKQIRDALQEEGTIQEMFQDAFAFLKNPLVLDQSIVSIDTYPSILFKVKGQIERSGITFPVIMKSWMVFYEDKIIALQAMGYDNSEFKLLEHLYSLITNSVIFPEQYNY